MKNLFFTMSKSKNFGINFVSHRGAQYNINPGESIKVPFVDDPLSDKEVLDFYNTRYEPLGLETKILCDGTTVDDVPVNAIEAAIKDEVKEEPKVKVEEPKIQPATEAKVEIKESEVTPIDEDEEKDPEVEYWSMNELRDYVKDHDIKVTGKSKDDFIKAVKEFMAEQ